MSHHIVITYSAERASEGHVDPNFTQLVYGDSGRKGNILKSNLSPGSYIFFNARIGAKRYLTAYFYVEKMLFKGEHDEEIESLTCSAKEDEVIIIGSRLFSKVLTIPLDFDRGLIGEIKSYGADNNYFEQKKANGVGELEAIRDKTLNPKVITEEEKEMLITLCKNRG
ncbi:hypothetical protein [Niallia endozanthoxylica]|uniref:Uncharacterized protein n=1 Tax=Niallia endozanthoxylica TaxID=2036016 RepID=A0A5J5HP31_9BACI|nr:hypothetical protein [Niallia endozanthoxylica]KAA9023563.1 hypothetical protein F4V44_12920 [Niallia endozanthoxylica]